MKTILAVLVLGMSASAHASNTTLTDGKILRGVDLQGKLCTVEIIKVKNRELRPTSIVLEATFSNMSVTSTVSDIGFALRGIEPGARGQSIFSNLFLNKDGKPESFDLSEMSTSEVLQTCSNLK